MLTKKTTIFTTLLTFLLMQSCAHIEDYMLGKDNTPKPQELTNVKTKVNLVENWSVPVAKIKKYSAKTQPVINNNIIYLANTNRSIQAINKRSGNVLWTKNLPEEVLSGPHVAFGYIAIGTNSSGVILLKQDNGEQLWQTKVSGDVLAAPVVTKDKVIAKTIDGNLYAFDIKTGEKIWVVDHGAPNLILQASSSPVITDKIALVGFADGNLDAIDMQSGAVVWQKGIAYATGSSDVERLVDIDANPIIEGDTVYLATYQGYIGALSLRTGDFLWKKPASTYKNIASDSNFLYMTDSDDIVWAYDKNNGQVQWKQIALQARGLTEPVLMGNQLVIGDKTGYLHVLSRKNGEFMSRTKLNGAIEASPVVSENSMYVMTTNGKLNSISLG